MKTIVQIETLRLYGLVHKQTLARKMQVSVAKAENAKTQAEGERPQPDSGRPLIFQLQTAVVADGGRFVSEEEEPQEPDKAVRYVYFPRNGVASIVARMIDGRTVEVSTVGNEGVVGLSAYLGDGRFPMDIFVQIPGEAVRMDADAFRREVRADEAFAKLIRKYTQALIVQIGQSAACNRVHPIDQRCAGWLLMSHDRVLGQEIDLTQEFLAEMLGVRRAGVTQAAGNLRRRKLIDYRRGKIRVVDRKGLEKAACECYAFIRAQYDRQMG